MQYIKLNGEFYLRLDPPEEIMQSVIEMCEREKIYGGHFQGIGACGDVTLSTYLPEVEEFLFHDYSGLLEMVSLIGNVTKNDAGRINLHAHALFSHLDDDQEIVCIGGHLRRAVVSYTAEIILRPANAIIEQRFDIVPKVGVWDFSHEKI